ncbi:MAG: hypothetical protein WC682_03080 [Parcubacteria group bacterium]
MSYFNIIAFVAYLSIIIVAFGIILIVSHMTKKGDERRKKIIKNLQENIFTKLFEIRTQIVSAIGKSKQENRELWKELDKAGNDIRLCIVKFRDAGVEYNGFEIEANLKALIFHANLERLNLTSSEILEVLSKIIIFQNDKQSIKIAGEFLEDLAELHTKLIPK